MPATTPSPRVVVQRQEVSAELFTIVRIDIRIPDIGNPQIIIDYVFRDGQGVQVGQKNVVLEGASYDAFVAANTTLYGNVKNAAYQVLIDEGILPANAVIS